MPKNNKPRTGGDAGCGRANGQGVLPGFTIPNASPEINSHFDGDTFDPLQDGPRLSRQLAAVFTFMADGQWRALEQIASAAECSEASASARLRDLRKQKFGGHVVDRRRAGGGVYLYRLILRKGIS